MGMRCKVGDTRCQRNEKLHVCVPVPIPIPVPVLGSRHPRSEVLCFRSAFLGAA